jgi:uncharacterized protein with PQ loop repeat
MANPVFQDSFHGFVDYSACFPDQDPIWMVLGLLLFLGTWISVIPQYYAIVHSRSNFGLNSLAIAGMVFGQWILVANVLCLQTPDFIGWLQLPFAVVIERSFTFINIASNWVSFLPCSFMALIFFDLVPRVIRTPADIKKERKLSPIFAIIGPVLCAISMVIYGAVGILEGFESDAIDTLGRIYGTIAAVFWSVQYVPQIWMTFKLKSSGNLSLIFLGIQAPGSMLNAIFMGIGQSDDWTTWLSSGILSIEQFVILAMGLYYDCCRRLKRDASLPLISEEFGTRNETYESK